jgi:diguanylate cyclase (GGDEF)-like protein
MSRYNTNLWLLLTLIGLLAVASQINAQIIDLNSHWQVCPTKEFIEKVDPQKLDCKAIELPNEWESVLGDYDGFAVMHTRFYAPRNLTQNQLAFFAKRIRDADKVFINDQLIGETGRFPPDFEKAVFYSRLYPIPLNVINFESENDLKIWIFNDARPGGLMAETPKIGNYFEFEINQQKQNSVLLILIVMLMVFSLVHFINYAFNTKSKDTLYFGVFLLGWSFYLLTGSDLITLYELPLNAVFRFNVMLFFIIFSSFILFVYKFFRQPLPVVIRVIIYIALTCIPFAMFLPEPKHLYYPVELIETLSIPSLVYVVMLIITVTRNSLPYSKIMAIVICLYLIFGIAEILLDLFFANEATTYSPIGPWVLLVLSLALTLIVGHKNMSYYQKATFDALTRVLRFDCFVERCERLIARAERDHKPILVMMVDLDDFKMINDQYGHIVGDKVLVQASQLMRDELRQFDLIGRYGGDEFCIAVMMNSVENIKSMVTRIHKHLNQKTIPINNDQTIPVKATIGATIYHPKRPRLSTEMLVERADKRLIHGKANAKGQINW